MAKLTLYGVIMIKKDGICDNIHPKENFRLHIGYGVDSSDLCGNSLPREICILKEQEDQGMIEIVIQFHSFMPSLKVVYEREIHISTHEKDYYSFILKEGSAFMKTTKKQDFKENVKAFGKFLGRKIPEINNMLTDQ